MAVAGAIIGAIAGGVASAVSTQLLTRKNANAYRSYAKDIRNAAKKYSGQNAYNAMQNAGMQEANIVNQRNLNAQASATPSNMTNKAANAASLQGNYSQGYNLGAQNQKTALDSAYNAETAKAQQALNQANIDYKAGTAATQAAMNAAGGLASLYGQIKGSGSQMTSDERVKEYNNHSGLPKADVDDALRRIESINYKYKDGTGLDNEEHTGITAQSAEGTAFDDMVSENSQGIKQLDKQMMLEAVLAGIASLRKELDELENSNDKITSDERCKTVENAIEADPVQAAQRLPQDSPIQKEAVQAIDGGKDAEVRNDVVEDFLDNDFFENYAKQHLGGNDDFKDAKAFMPSIYSTPKIDRAKHSDYRNGDISKEEYKKQLENQLKQSNEALSKASQMMSDERNRVEAEGGQFNRGHVGVYAFPAGSAKSVAEKKLGELDTDEFTDADAKYYSKHANFDDLTYGEDYTHDTANSIDWDKVKVYKPGEDPYYKVTDEHDWKDNPDYELENFIENHPEEAVISLPEGPAKQEAEQILSDDDKRNDEVNDEKIKDEDFLGPDEYIDGNGNIQVDPNWKPDDADEDFVGPDEQLVPLGSRDLIHPNYGFSYNIEEIDRQPGTPEETEFESKIVDVNDMGLLGAKPVDIGGSAASPVSQAPLAEVERHTGGSAIGTKGILPASALHFDSSSMAGGSTPSSKHFDGFGKVGTIDNPHHNNADASVVTGKQSESSGFVTNNGGNVNSGATNFRNSLAHIGLAQLPSEVEEHTAPEYESLLETENLKDALINRIHMMLDELDPRTLKQLGFSPVGHYYKGTSLSKLDGSTLAMLSEILEEQTND